MLTSKYIDPATPAKEITPVQIKRVLAEFIERGANAGAKILKRQREKYPDAMFLFPGNTKEGHLLSAEYSKQLRKFYKLTGFDKFTPRDIRRTFKTLAGDMGISTEMRDRLQNHKRPGVSEKHYDRYDYLRENEK
ncbi:hypothetical protein E05_32630 [Plautia stali symbiont]|nr:hypothetical protein E05_32630 [Plautia stali symbiont]